jgi:hypothetical protein
MNRWRAQFAERRFDALSIERRLLKIVTSGE